MSIETVVTKQLQGIIDNNATQARKLSQPKNASWIKLVREALGMSGAQLGRKMGVSRGLISRTEKAEIEGRVTLRKMSEFAEAMECQFVYTMVPNDKITDIIKRRAEEKAKAIVNRTNEHMALEAQALSDDQIESEIERLTQEMLNEKLSELWSD